MKPDFTNKLLEWDRTLNNRPMPWKGETDPYRIWLSEIILQQTRVEQGWQYYERFVREFPTVLDLANASPERVYKLWEGLGYYTRCRNLHATAKIIAGEHNGRFPSTYNDIIHLKGVGPYTAAAIASFAFNLPYAVVDGNVQRIISRYFGINTPIGSASGKKMYQELAQSLLDTDEPGKYNQAIMDFGATICKPQKPLCAQCVQRDDCQAFQHGWVDSLPVKEKALNRKTRWFNYFVMEQEGGVYIRQRNGKDIWTNLFEFVLHESEDALLDKQQEVEQQLQQLVGHRHFDVRAISKPYRQQLTHQTIHGQFIRLHISKPPAFASNLLFISKEELGDYAFPKMINAYMEDVSGTPLT
jgi:A/G-specific adenine glycosylase